MFFLYVNEGKLGGGQFILTTTEQGKRKLSMWKKKELKENLCKDGLETRELGYLRFCWK